MLQRSLLVASSLLLACVASPGDDPQEPASTSTAPPSGSSGPDQTTGAPPPATTSGPGTTTEPDGTTVASDDAATTDPGVYFDLGQVPDAPEGMIPGCQSAVDIVFVMDVSTTMASFINILSDEILVVDAALQALELDQFAPGRGLPEHVEEIVASCLKGPDRTHCLGRWIPTNGR